MNDEVGDPNAPADEWIGRVGGGEGGEIKLRQKQKEAKCPKKAIRSHCNRLSLQSGRKGRSMSDELARGEKVWGVSLIV